MKITLQFEPANVFLWSLTGQYVGVWGQLYFCGLILKAMISRLKSLKFASYKIFNCAHFFNRQIRYPVKHQNT